MVMDYIRAGYKSTIKPWQGLDVEVPIEWFRADPGARVFPGMNAFVSKNWMDPKGPSPVGEVWPNYQGYSRGANTLGYRGRSFCGRMEAFEFGGVIGVDAPIITRADGYSTCCGPGAFPAIGGEGVNGAALFVRAGQGGELVGGAAGFSLNQQLGTGGEAVSGAAGGFAVNRQDATGGESVGGAASFPPGAYFPARGGEVLNGAADQGGLNRWAGAGGDRLNGAAASWAVNRQQASGGELLAAALGSSFAEGPFFPASGGELGGGAAGFLRGVFQLADGGELVNGAADQGGGAQLPAIGGELVNGAADQGGGASGPSVRGFTTGTGSGDFSFGKPTGTASGDRMMFFCARYLPFGGEPTPPAGWSVAINSAVSEQLYWCCFYKTAGGSEPADYAVGAGSGSTTPWVCLSVADATFAEVPGLTNFGFSDGPTAPGITSPADGSLAVFFTAAEAFAVITAPSGMDLVGAPSSANASALVATESVAGGPTGDKVASMTATTIWGAVLGMFGPP